MEAWPSCQRIGRAVRRSLVRVPLLALAEFVRLCLPECTSSVTLADWLPSGRFFLFFFLNYLFLITVIEWSTLKVAGKEKCALNLQTFTFSNATGQSTVLVYTKLIYLMFCFFLTVKAEFSHTCIYKLEILSWLS